MALNAEQIKEFDRLCGLFNITAYVRNEDDGKTHEIKKCNSVSDFTKIGPNITLLKVIYDYK